MEKYVSECPEVNLVTVNTQFLFSVNFFFKVLFSDQLHAGSRFKMLLTKLILTASLVGVIFTIRCYSGMQGSVNGDVIGEIELLDCNGTDFCIKLPANGHVGRKHYEGAQYSCDSGECRKEGCNRRPGGGMLCCCSTDECNESSQILNNVFPIVIFTAVIMFLARH
ncbi:hypothetical protein CRE_17058 [Caenorhabditis remanei]|uniref:Uncharacterized protein n=1 Tax=Caenorhabditis remanei TaxID=31234 RepID=E3M9X6_CAERE|nr:hypothetical protein CRE_17058 [Caenorhabditis remanei]